MGLLGGQLQTGIYYGKKSHNTKPGHSSKNGRLPPNSSFAILFLRASQNSSATQVEESLGRLWQMYQGLERGKIYDLPNCHVPSDGLSILIAYGPDIFRLSGVRKKIPDAMKDRQFLPAEGGKPILKGSGIRFAKDIHENLGGSEHVALQFVANTQLATYRAIVETWKHLHDYHMEEPLRLTKFYTGFRRDDMRSWLGFHDEISNMKNAKEREQAIAIDVINNNLGHKDFWTKNGTYLAFLRIEINLNIWQRIGRKDQELMIGRDKLNGYPLIGVDKNGNPIPYKLNASNNPRRLIAYDPKFRDHPDYFKKPVVSDKFKSKIDIEASFRALNQSHIGRTRHIDRVDSKYPTSRRIFRQGFEFFEHLDNNPVKPFRIGLNFTSFQNDPSRLFFILTDPNWLGNANFGGDSNIQGIDRLFSVVAGGVFFVPPVEEPFPGANIFI
jgi:Dyp-type peroxidase family